MNGTNEIICKGCYAATNNVFRTLNSEQESYLNENKSVISYKKGDILYSEGNRITGVFCVHTGNLKIFKTGSDGKNQIVSFARPGDITGYRSVLSNEPACTTAQTLDKCTICFIPSFVIHHLVRSNGDFALALMQLTCKELNIANTYIKDIAQKNVRERLAETLITLEDTFGTDSDGYLNIILTREELSNIIGTATESVIRLLSEFNVDGFIVLNGKKIKIKNRDILVKLSKTYF